MFYVNLESLTRSGRIVNEKKSSITIKFALTVVLIHSLTSKFWVVFTQLIGIFSIFETSSDSSS